MRIIWMPRALRSFFQVYDFAKTNQGEKQAQDLAQKARENISLIVSQPYMFPAYDKRKYLRKAFITKFVSMFYRVKPRKKEIELLKFHDNRQDPKKINL
jgi:plasmid stabilization system protein ParE